MKCEKMGENFDVDRWFIKHKLSLITKGIRSEANHNILSYVNKKYLNESSPSSNSNLLFVTILNLSTSEDSFWAEKAGAKVMNSVKNGMEWSKLNCKK